MTTDATAIRDAIFVLLQTLPGYTRVRKTPVRQLQPTDCPALTIVMGDEVANADEDATAGPPHFVHEATYHVSVLRAFDDPDTLDGKIEDDCAAIQNLLLRNVGLNQMIEGITSMRRSRAFPQQGETYFVELRLELTVQFRTIWNPVTPDAFTGMDVDSLPVGATVYPPSEPVHLTIDVEADT